MSKAVRIREHLYEEISRLAARERRSLIAQLELLLEQALRMDELSERGLPPVGAEGSHPRRLASSGPRSESPDHHFKPDPK